MPLPSTALTVPCTPPAITRLEPSSRVPRAIVVFLMSFRYMRITSVIVVLSMPPRLHRGCGSSCRCLRYAAYTHGLKQVLCHRLAKVTYFFIVPCVGTVICLIYYTLVMSDGLLLARMPGALSLAHSAGLWERGGGCRFVATPVAQPTSDQYGAMALDTPVEGEIQGQRRCRFPTTQRRLTQASPRDMALRAPGRYGGARASCRSSATVYGHWLADICHKV